MTGRRAERRSLGRRVLDLTFNLVVAVVVLGCLAWIAPSAFGYSRYVITGGSMEPTIHRGSVVFEKPTPVADLEVGDVITYLPPAGSGTTSLVTHRIIAMEPAEGGGVLFTTQGDANPDPDPWHFQLVDEQQPVVEQSVPYVGWAFVALADRTTRMLLIGGPAVLIALYALGQVLAALRPRPAGATEPGGATDDPAPADTADRATALA